VHRAISVVDRLLRIAQHERAARLLGRVMARIRARDREAVLERRGALLRAAWIVESLARETAVTDHVEAAVPRGGQVDLERDLGLEHAVHAAVRRDSAVRRDRARGDLDELWQLDARELCAFRLR